jgi:hypothetical protein
MIKSAFIRLIVLGSCLALVVAGFGVGFAKQPHQGNHSKAAAVSEVQLAWVSINTGGVAHQSSKNYAAGLSCGQAVSGESLSKNYRVTFGFWQAGVTSPTDVEEIVTPELPFTYSLSQNYPNPFNPSTVIEFTVPRRGQIEISVYNLLGQRVTTLIDEPMQPGVYRTVWYGTDQAGRRVASGIYFYRLEAERFVQTKKMVLLK